MRNTELGTNTPVNITGIEKLDVDSYSMGQRRYLGGKTKLLDSIYDLAENKLGAKPTSIFDVFAGTGVVSERFIQNNASVVANDILFHNYLSLEAFMGNEFIYIDELVNKIKYLQKVKGSSNYFSKNFGGTFFSESNARKIGAIRSEIDKISNDGREKHCLISSLIYATDKIANTVGHYDAFHRAQNNTKNLTLRIPKVFNNDNKNIILNQDANDVVSKYEADIIYIDPPYNSRQYSDAYHLLENLALWEKPKLFGVAKKMDRTNIKSKYCGKSAPEAFSSLIEAARGKFIIVSFNNTGESKNSRSNSSLTDSEILKPLKSRGKVKTININFSPFTTGKTDNVKEHVERLFVCEVNK